MTTNNNTKFAFVAAFASVVIAFAETKKSITLNEKAEGSTKNVNGVRAAKSTMNAYWDLCRFNRYPDAIVGLHPVNQKAEAMVDLVAIAMGTRPLFGYLTSSYLGENPSLKALVARMPQNEFCVVPLVKTGEGTFAGTGTICASTMPKPAKNEPEKVRMNRNIFYKHAALDLILRGTRINVAPFLMEGETGVDKHYSVEAVEKFWNSQLEMAQLDDAAALLRRDDKVEDKRAYQALGKNVAKALAGDENVGEGIGSVLTVDGLKISAMDLLGHTVYFHNGKGRKLPGAHEVTADSLRGVLQTVTAFGYTVSL